MDIREKIIQYVPFMSFVHPSFWHTLTEMKLDIDKLSENTKQIYGRFSCRDDIGTIFEADGTSFNKEPEIDQLYENVTGTIMNKNTIDDFKAIDKASLLNSVGEIIWSNILKKSWIYKPNILTNFFILSFADLKKFHYYYWFAFPAPSQPTVYLKDDSQDIINVLSNKQIDELFNGYNSLDVKQRSYFAAIKDKDSILVKCLSDIFDSTKQEQFGLDLSNICLVYTDASNTNNPGWPLRLFLAAVYQHCPDISEISVIGLRFSPNLSINNSRVFTVIIPKDAKSIETSGWVGWERNDRGNFGPKLANMSASMDPIKLADTSSDLNIKLMKWRLAPDLDVDIMKKTKCLLLGAGTLGCQVARDLLAWGFRHITFLDNGKVSYSNPARQVLFNYEDSLHGGKKKANAAADNMKLILPSVDCRGISAHIPMPGHPVGESLKEETLANVKLITDAIQEHDVVFLLLDTREARWLPTLLAAHYKKIAINAALGFDSYLVIRHGIATQNGSDSSQDSVAKALIPGSDLGCYFCNDVTAPGNSTKDRTLDQQCTVTRPGVSAIAGALAVEVLVALLQHPQGIDAPAPYNIKASDDLPPQTQGVLGPVPHSIRGFLHSYQTVTPSCTKFKQCIACSNSVLQKYVEEGIDFLMNVFNSGTYLEEVTGLSALHLTAEMTDVMTLTDEEDEFSE